MRVNFLDQIRDIEDPRVPGMVLYPLDEVLLTVLVGLLCRAEDVDEIEDICTEMLDWLRLFLPFERGIAPAQTLRRTLARLDPRRLEEAFAAWTASLPETTPIAADNRREIKALPHQRNDQSRQVVPWHVVLNARRKTLRLVDLPRAEFLTHLKSLASHSTQLC